MTEYRDQLAALTAERDQATEHARNLREQLNRATASRQLLTDDLDALARTIARQVNEHDNLRQQLDDTRDTGYRQFAAYQAASGQHAAEWAHLCQSLAAYNNDEQISVGHLRDLLRRGPGLIDGTPADRKDPYKVSPPLGGWPAGGKPAIVWMDCVDCGDTIYAGEHVYPAGEVGVRCAICEVRTRRADLADPGEQPTYQDGSEAAIRADERDDIARQLDILAADPDILQAWAGTCDPTPLTPAEWIAALAGKLRSDPPLSGIDLSIPAVSIAEVAAESEA